MRLGQFATSVFTAILLALPVVAQTTNFTATLAVSNQPDNAKFFTIFQGTSQVGTLGAANLIFQLAQQLSDDEKSGTGSATNTLIISFNRLDSIAVNSAQITDLTAPVITIGGRLGTGTGSYANLTNATANGGSTTMTLTRISTSPLRYTLNMTGSGVMNGQTVGLNIANTTLTFTSTVAAAFAIQTGTGNITPFGPMNVTVNAYPSGAGITWSTGSFVQVIATFTSTQNQNDSIKLSFSFTGNLPSLGDPVAISGGTGIFAGASGSGTLTAIGGTSTTNTVTVTGTITQAGTTTPIITSARTAGYTLERITQNAWIEIKGTNLVPTSTPAGGTFWSNAPEFAQGKMPTQLGNTSVTVNGKPAYIWWFCSKATGCASDQINVLTPLDDAINQYVQVVVKNGNVSSAPYLVPKDNVNPSPLLWDTTGHGVITHANGNYLGPLSLIPGSSTPAKQGETVVVWLTGFGLPTTTLLQGSATQSGSLPLPVNCILEGATVPVAGALSSPGLYQLNVTVPNNTPAGDNHLTCNYNGSLMPGILVAVQ